MKKTKEIEVDVCDVCDGEELVSICMGCGKAACWNCRQKGEMENFSHSVYCSGSGDGTFCPACLVNPPEKIRPLLTIYYRIRALRNEANAEHEDFKKRCKEAEEELKALQALQKS